MCTTCENLFYYMCRNNGIACWKNTSSINLNFIDEKDRIFVVE